MTQELIHKIESKDGKQSYVFEIKDGKLFYAWKRFGDAGSRTFPLSSLSPDFGYQETFRGEPRVPFQIGIFGVITSLLILMSEMQRHAKAAVIIVTGAVALIGFLTALTRLPKVRQTYIMSKKDAYMVSFEHGSFETEALELFLAQLKEAIGQAEKPG